MTKAKSRKTIGLLLSACLFGCGGKVVIDRNGDGGGSASSDAPCPADVLTDTHNCGSCGHDCLGGSCASGVCQLVTVVTLEEEFVDSLVVDDSKIFWSGFGGIGAANKDGSGALKIVAGSYPSKGMAVDGQHVYWTMHSESIEETSRVDKQGASAAELIGPAGYRIAVDDTHVYGVWYGVWKAPKSGGETTYLVDNLGVQGIAVDESHVYFSHWSFDDIDGVYKLPKSGGSPQKIGSSLENTDVAVFGDKVFWGSHADSAIYAVSKSGGDQAVIATADQPFGITVDATGVYWFESDLGNVWVLPAGWTTPLLLASGEEHPRDLAIDDEAVYWISVSNLDSTSRIRKVRKP